MASRFDRCWEFWWSAVAACLLVIFGGIELAHAYHGGHVWSLDHYEYVIDARGRQVKRCVFRCDTSISERHYTIVIGGAHSCPVP